MKLFLDVGNTRLKWLLLASNNTKKILCAKKGSFPLSDLEFTKKPAEETTFFKQIKISIAETNQQLANQLTVDNRSLKTIVWICVAPKLIEKKVVNILCKLYGKAVPKKIITPINGKLKFETDWGQVFLKCNYEHPNKFGADRWAASVGLAFLGPPSLGLLKKSKEIILVSAGTSTVIDKLIWSRVSKKKWVCELKGGLILPGFNQMSLDMKFLNKSLSQNNDQLTHYPKNTTEAINTGIAFSQAFLEKDQNKIVLVHGGKSDKWVESYTFFNPTNIKPIKLPWLIFEGLFLINKAQLNTG